MTDTVFFSVIGQVGPPGEQAGLILVGSDFGSRLAFEDDGGTFESSVFSLNGGNSQPGKMLGPRAGRNEARASGDPGVELR